MPIHTHFLGDFSSKVGHIDLVFGVPSEFVSTSGGMQDYKSVCSVVTICATMVDPKLDFTF